MNRRDFCSFFPAAVGSHILNEDLLLGNSHSLDSASADSSTLQSRMAVQLEKSAAASGFIYAPRFLGALLSLLARSSTGKTSSEIRSFIGVKDNSDSRTLARAYSDGNPRSPGASVSDRCSLWLPTATTVSRSLMVDANRLFNADIFTTGFPEARIADWVARHTNGRMERYHVPNGTEFLAINAAAIKSRWEISFDPTLSKIRRFVGSSTTSRVRFMQRDGYFELLENASFKILRLRLQNRFSIYFGLRSPGANGKVDEFLGYALKSGSFDHRRARVLIPQFSLNKHTNLKSSLITEGLIAAFSPAAQFDQIGNVRITNAFQDIAFAIDEVGAEVESATTFVQQQGMTLEPTIFNANRPFYYSLIEDQTNHVFLIGSMENM